MQSNHVPQNGSFEVGRNASSYINPIAQESTSYAVFNGTPSDSSEQFIAGSKPSGLSSRPQPAVNEQAKTYWSQGPYRSLPPWLSSSTDDILTSTYSPQLQKQLRNCLGNNL